MSTAVLIDYGCHSFSYRLASRLRLEGVPIRYFANGSLESPNLTSLPIWERNHPELIRTIRCKNPYGKVNLARRLKGEMEWAAHCIRALESESPSVVIGSCLPLTVLTRLQNWALSRTVPFIYWMQDLQGRAIHDLLGHKLGFPGQVLGSFAHVWEQHLIERSHMVITIAAGHERELPYAVQRDHRFKLLENWANIEDIPLCPTTNDWSVRHGLHATKNVVYTGTLGLKHDLATFIALASTFRMRPEVRVVVVSGGEAAEKLRAEAQARKLDNLIVLPFQEFQELPQVLGSAAVLIAPLDGAAGSFCVPSKVLSYLCAGRPTVIAIDNSNPAAAMIEKAEAGFVTNPRHPQQFIAAVDRLLNNAQLRSSLGQAARRYAELTFTLEAVMAKFLNILEVSGIPVEMGAPFQIPFSATA